MLRFWRSRCRGARLRVLDDGWIALAGADLGASLKPWTAKLVAAGEVLDFRGGASGLWAYLAVPGGFGGGAVLWQFVG